VSDSRSSDIAVLMVMQTQIRVMLRAANRLVHEKTAATAAAARRSAAGEAFRGHRPAWNARGVLADGEALWAPYAAEAASAYADGYSESFTTTRRAGRRRSNAGARGAGKVVVFAVRRASIRKRGAESRGGGFVGTRAAERGAGAGSSAGRQKSVETGHTVGSEAEPELRNIFIIDGMLGGEALSCDVAAQDKWPADLGSSGGFLPFLIQEKTRHLRHRRYKSNRQLPFFWGRGVQIGTFRGKRY
jgi:hypothetical protein